MHVLIVSSEIYPYAKTGGLADMVGSLAKSLSNLGHDVRVILPFYKNIYNLNLDVEVFVDSFTIKLGDEKLTCKIYEYLDINSGITLYLIEHLNYFNRNGFYNENNKDYPDNAERFIFFSKAAIKLCKFFQFNIDIIHCHDWQTGLIPAFLKSDVKNPKDNIPLQLKHTKSVFTIHNLGYQGNFPEYYYKMTGLPKAFFSIDGLEFYGGISFLKAGIYYSDIITTVSSTYAKEIQTHKSGFGLDGLLKARRDKLIGIPNGIDENIWNPEIDTFLLSHYNSLNLENKKKCKTELQENFGLNINQDIPLIGGISRLVHQKGYDMVASVLPGLLSHNIQFVLLGTGDVDIENNFADLAKHYQNFKFYNGYNEHLAHLIIAGSDIFIIPSRYEPCGLTQMYSLKYGTIPIAHATGGLEDTIKDFNEINEEGNGLKFKSFSSSNFISSVIRATNIYKSNKNLWNKFMLNGMKENHNWSHRVLQYHNLYRNLLKSY